MGKIIHHQRRPRARTQILHVTGVLTVLTILMVEDEDELRQITARILCRDPCAGCRPVGQHKSSSPGMPSCRTCAAATTTSHSTFRRRPDSPPPPPASREPSDKRRPRI